MSTPTPNEPPIDLGLLKTFLAVAEEGSISAGARRVFRTQSTASTQIQNLEELCGVRLFERDTRRLAPTAEGTRLIEYAQRLLLLSHETLVALRGEAVGRTLRIGFSEYFQPERLGQLVRRLQAQWPDCRFELRVGQSSLIERELGARKLDLVVLSKLTRAAAAKSERLHWVSSPDFALPARGEIPLVLLPPECGLHALALRSLKRAGTPHRLAVTCSGTTGVHAALRAQLGVGCLNEGAIPADLSVRTDRRLPGLPRLAFVCKGRRDAFVDRVVDVLSEGVGQVRVPERLQTG